MRWWVRLDDHLVGWVIAATEAEALGHAHTKYASPWGIESTWAVELDRR